MYTSYEESRKERRKEKSRRKTGRNVEDRVGQIEQRGPPGPAWGTVRRRVESGRIARSEGFGTRAETNVEPKPSQGE